MYLAKKALMLYSNGGTNDVSAPSFNEIEENFKSAIKEVQKIAPTPAMVNNLLNDKESMIKFVKAFQKLDKSFGEVQVYNEWADKDLERDYGITRALFDEYSGKYQNVLETLKQMVDPDGDDTLDIDIEYELETIRIETIDYRYLMALIQKHIPDDDQTVCIVADDKVDEYLKQMNETNPALAEIVRQFWDEMKQQPEKFKGMDAMSIIERRIDFIIESQVDTLVKAWSVKKNEVMFVLDNYKKSAPINVEMDYGSYKKNEVNALSKLQYKRKVKEAIAALADRITPLRNK